MKKLILLSAITFWFNLAMIGCSPIPENKHTARAPKEDQFFEVVVFDNCEYIRANAQSVMSPITHKGNCKFCEERRGDRINAIFSQHDTAWHVYHHNKWH